MVSHDHMTRRTVLQKGAATASAIVGLGVVGSASGASGSKIRFEADSGGNYSVAVVGTFEDIDTYAWDPNFGDSITQRSSGDGIIVQGEVATGWGAEGYDVVQVDEQLSVNDIWSYPPGVDDGVTVKLDGSEISV